MKTPKHAVTSMMLRASRWCLASVLVACKDECLRPPCPYPGDAVAVTVSTASGSPPPAGLTVALQNGTGGPQPCDANVCRISGGPGRYDVTIAAPGFLPAQLHVTVTGEAAACNTCGRVDRRDVSVVLQPASS